MNRIGLNSWGGMNEWDTELMERQMERLEEKKRKEEIERMREEAERMSEEIKKEKERKGEEENKKLGDLVAWLMIASSLKLFNFAGNYLILHASILLIVNNNICLGRVKETYISDVSFTRPKRVFDKKTDNYYFGGRGYRGSYMSAHVLLNLLTSWGREIKCEACRAFYLFFATNLINTIIQEHEC